MRARSFALTVALTLSACSAPPEMMTTPDSGMVPMSCASSSECDDGQYCNGAEHCMPGAVGASAIGCVAGTAPCGGMCDEAADMCVVSCTTDADGDGAIARSCGGPDCDDTDPHSFPGNTEICDAADVDEDCDPTTFGDRDADGDGADDATCCNVGTSGTRRCGDDCDDHLAGVHPSAPEVCNGHDDDCDVAIDEAVLMTFHPDEDGDLFGDPAGATMTGCTATAGYVSDDTDCDDTLAMVHPGASAPCTCGMQDADGDDHVTDVCGGDDCDDSIAAVYTGAPELCDGLDDVCAAGGGARSSEDADGDGFAALAAPCAGGPLPRSDCDDATMATHPGATDVCNDVDDDCDGAVDGEPSATASCTLAHGAPICTSGACAIASCDSGYHACGAACAANDSVASCGSSCTPCTVPTFGAASCDATSCGFVCDAGYRSTGTACVPIAPPRPISPLSTATVSTMRPTLRWSLPAGTDGARVELCSDRACTTVLRTIDATGSSVAPSSDLPSGVVFWRLYGRAGTGTGLTPSPTWEMFVGRRSRTVDSSWGTTLDVNGDGYADLLTSANALFTEEGRAYVYLGGPTGLSTSRSTLQGTGGPYERFGAHVQSAGDVNGDGFGDALIAGTHWSSDRGRVYVFLGSATGLPTTAATILLGPDGNGARFGNLVRSAGDVNGDGYGDVVIGTPLALSSVGAAHVYLGSATGTTSVAIDLPVPDAGMAQFGQAATGLGDLDGDGYGELAVSAPGAAHVHIYPGGPSGPVLASRYSVTATANAVVGGDADGDGRPDMLATDAGRVLLFAGTATGLSATSTIVASGVPSNGFGSGLWPPGDVDGDGYDDLLVAEPSVLIGSSRGRLSWFRGVASGFSATATTVILPPASSTTQFGWCTALGDVDRDGFADVVAGTSGDERVFLFAGGSSGPPTAPSTTITTTEAAAFFGSFVSL
jgi:hypothetical protein